MISVEFFQADKHYETVAKWWADHNWPAVPLSHLPQTGIIVSHNGKPAAATWIYKTDSAFCWMEWIVANPEIRREARSSCLSVLISTAKILAKFMGFRSIYMSISNPSLAQRIEAQGFKSSDQEMTNYVCDLSEGAK